MTVLLKAFDDLDLVVVGNPAGVMFTPLSCVGMNVVKVRGDARAYARRLRGDRPGKISAVRIGDPPLADEGVHAVTRPPHSGLTERAP